MAAPKGNEFWKLRSKHGRDKLFSTPDLLWEAAVEYFEATDKRKWVKKDWVGKDAFEVERETSPPYTMTGLFLYLDINHSYLSDFKKTCSKDFSAIITRIEQIIYNQKFEGASVGAYNANIIARDLGLTDKKEISGEMVNKNYNLSSLTAEELAKLNEITSKIGNTGGAV